MKTVFGIGLIILGIFSIFSYSNFGVDGAETLGVLIGVSLITFIPGGLLIRSDNKSKTN